MKTRLNRRRLYIFCLSLLGLSWTNSFLAAADPVNELKQWLKADRTDRPSFSKQEFANQPLTKQQAQTVKELLVNDFRQAIKKSRKQEWDDKKIKLDKLEMKFEYKVFGKKPKSGRRLFISMHGGGGAPARVNDQQWRNQIGLYQPEEGVYLAPRAATNTWNLWHQSHIDQFFQRIIEDAIVFADVDPNHVYIMGYSAGGDGVYQLAPRMADSLAAAAMMAGHPNDASPLGLRNIGFTLHMGGKDGAYNRNKVAREWKTKLEKLQKDDPQGYKHHVQIHEKYGHWMNREDRVAVPWMSKFARDPYPKKIVWHQSTVLHNRFYWLAAEKSQQIARSTVVASRDGHTINVEKAKKVNSIKIRLNDELMNLDQPVTIRTPNGEKKSIKLERKAAMIYQCLEERFDPASIFCAEKTIQLTSKP